MREPRSLRLALRVRIAHHVDYLPAERRSRGISPRVLRLAPDQTPVYTLDGRCGYRSQGAPVPFAQALGPAGPV